MKKNIVILVLLMFAIRNLVAQEIPNFVLIIADDVGWNDLGCYGNNVVKTPNIDGLSSKGLVFDNAFLTASSCSPSRCSIISGKYPHSNGAAELHTTLPSSQVPFPLLLKERGYYTMHAGKWHMGDAPRRAFDRSTNGTENEDGNGGEANWVRFLKERPRNKPFFAWYAAFDAHRPWDSDDLVVNHKPSQIEVPVYYADTPETRNDMASYYDEISRFDHHIGLVRNELKAQGVLNNTLIIIMSDNGAPFPRSKTRVYDSGMKTPFVVHWPKGIKNGNDFVESLISAIDIAPTLLDLAGVDIPEDYQGKSFAPIFKDSDIQIRKEVFSEHNWHDFEAYERMVRTREFLYVLNERPNLANGGPLDSKMSPTHKSLEKLKQAGQLTAAQTDIFATPRPREELFDVNSDPLQLINLAAVPAYAKDLEIMRNKLLKWQKETGDTLPENLTHDWYDRQTGELIDPKNIRGTMPGRIPNKE